MNHTPLPPQKNDFFNARPRFVHTRQQKETTNKKKIGSQAINLVTGPNKLLARTVC